MISMFKKQVRAFCLRKSSNKHPIPVLFQVLLHILEWRLMRNFVGDWKKALEWGPLIIPHQKCKTLKSILWFSFSAHKFSLPRRRAIICIPYPAQFVPYFFLEVLPWKSQTQSYLFFLKWQHDIYTILLGVFFFFNYILICNFPFCTHVMLQV